MSSRSTEVGRTRSWRFRLAVFVLSTLAVLVAAELALRWMLFGAGTNAASRRLRQAEWYTRGFDADYWKLQARFALATARPPPGPDARLGWTGDVEPGTCAHPDEARLGARETVLLYGDSFAECVTAAETCWQGLFERSEFAPRRRLLNYGVRGYGLDQIALMIERSVPRFAQRHPTVLIGIFVDDDLERCSTPVRGWPKPWFRLDHGRLVVEEPGLEPVASWIERHPPEIASYLVRLVRHAAAGADAFDASWTDESTLDERRALCRAILERIVATLDAHGIAERAFVLFDGEASIADSPRARWQRDLVRDFARERGIACVATGPFLLEALGGARTRVDELLTPPSSAQAGHYDETGNRVAFEAILQALRGDDGTSGLERVRAWRAADELRPARESSLRYTLLGRRLVCRGTRGEAVIRILDPVSGPARLSLRPGSSGPTIVEIEARGARTFGATLRAAGTDCPGGVTLTVEGGTARTEFPGLRSGDAPTPIDTSCDADVLRLTVKGGPGCAWIVLDDVHFGPR